MSSFQSPGELSLEALPDAPDGDWLPSIIENYNQTQRQLVNAFKRGLTDEENTTSRSKVLNLAHGIEVQCTSPLSVPVQGVLILQCNGLSLDSLGKPTGQVYPLATPVLSWRPTGKADGSVFVSASYPPPLGACTINLSTSQSISSGSLTAVVFTQEANKEGTNISWDGSSKLVFGASGIVRVQHQNMFEITGGGTYRTQNITMNNDTSVRHAYSFYTAGAYAGLNSSEELSVGAGDYIQSIVAQDSGSPLNVAWLGSELRSVMTAHYVAPPPTTMGRLNLFFYGG